MLFGSSVLSFRSSVLSFVSTSRYLALVGTMERRRVVTVVMRRRRLDIH